MNEILRKHIENGFSEFEGLSITGSIPLRDALLNRMLAEALEKMTRGAPEASSSSSGIAELAPALARLVKKAEVHAKEGAVVLEFEISR
jgi:hypothetical protein